MPASLLVGVAGTFGAGQEEVAELLVQRMSFKQASLKDLPQPGRLVVISINTLSKAGFIKSQPGSLLIWVNAAIKDRYDWLIRKEKIEIQPHREFAKAAEAELKLLKPLERMADFKLWNYGDPVDLHRSLRDIRRLRP